MKSMRLFLFALLSTCLSVGSVSAQCPVTANFTVYTSGDTIIVNNSSSSGPTIEYIYEFEIGNPSATVITQSTGWQTYVYNAPGTYAFCFTVQDSINGCFDSYCDTVTMNFTPWLVASATSTSATCGTCNGTATASSTGGTPAYSYLWSTGAATQTISALCPGNYSVTVSDANGVTSVATTIVQPDSSGAPDVSIPRTHETCLTCCDGTATIAVNNGSGVYTYQWSNGGGNVSSQSSLCPGTYTVTVTDSTGTCPTIKTLIINPFVCSKLITGTISPMGDATVYLIQENNGFLTAVDSVDIDSGSFWFLNVCPGTYYLKAALRSSNPSYSAYLPTYYTNAAQWAYATAVVMSSSNITGVNFTLQSGSNPGGQGFIGGLITQGANRTEGDPVVGAIVIVYDEAGDIAGFSRSDASGNYEVGDLAFGKYTIEVDLLNKTSYAHEVTLSAENPNTSDRNFEVTGTVIKPLTPTGVSETSSKTVLVYPNPADQKLFINGGENQIESIKVFNIIGECVHFERVTSTGLIDINTNKLATGTYIIEISGEGFTHHESIVRK